MLLSPVQCPPSEAREGKRSEPTTTIPSWYPAKVLWGGVPFGRRGGALSKNPRKCGVLPE